MNNFNWRTIATATLLSVLTACSTAENQQNTQNSNDNAGEKTGNLALVANGEDFIRQGFTTKDGWRIDFNHAYVTLNNVTAYQTDPPFHPESKEELQATRSIVLFENEPKTIDLALGDENAPSISVMEISAPIGSYNAINWSIVNSPETNAGVILDGIASKEGKTINFVLQLPLELTYLCGEYIGDERKGILEADQSTELEMTFHFDHLFGDSETASDDDLNLKALGFEPLAEVAQQDGSSELNIDRLKNELSEDNYNKLTDNLKSLGHVGEGHCRLE